MDARDRCLRVALLCLVLGGVAVRAPAQAPTRKGVTPWTALSVSFGSVSAQPTSNRNGVGPELTMGVELSRKFRVGLRYFEWFQLPENLFSPQWRARTIKAVVGYPVPRTILILTSGLGVTRAWDTVAPRGSVRALAIEGGIELLAPPTSRVRYRVYAIHDWAVDKWDPRGPIDFGSMNQWHLGMGLSLH